MIKFKAEPHLLINFNPPIGTIKRVQFDDKGEYQTDNERIIERFKHKYDSVPLIGMEEIKEMIPRIKQKPHTRRKKVAR